MKELIIKMQALLPWFIHKQIRKIRHYHDRVTIGISDMDVWNLWMYVDEVILAWLIKFKEQDLLVILYYKVHIYIVLSQLLL